MHNVAVYGTLKRGLSNSSLLSGQQFLGQGVTLDKFWMRDTGGFPVLFHGDVAPVRVEVYGVNDQVLAKLDQLEWNGRMFVRTYHEILVGAHNSRLKCFMYLGVEDFWKKRQSGLRDVTPVDEVLEWRPDYTRPRSA